MYRSTAYALNLFCVAVFFLLTAGCNRAPLRQVPAPAQMDTAPQTAEFYSITQLSPGKPTHLAADSIGNLYWVQETDDSHDLLFMLGQDGIPRATALSSNAILAAFEQPAPSVSQNVPSTASGGNIQSILAMPDGKLIFYFDGGQGRLPRTCVGVFNPQAGTIRILVDTDALAEKTQMGASLNIARGKLIAPTAQPPGQPLQIWLWIRHTDQSRLFRFEPLASRPGNGVELIPEFDAITGPAADEPLTSPSLDLCAGPDQSVFLCDAIPSAIWRVDSKGASVRVSSLIGLTTQLSEPALRADGSIVLFAGDGDSAVGMDRNAGDAAANLRDANVLKVKFPAMVVIADGHLTPIVSAEDMRLPAGVELAKLAIQKMIPTSDRKTWIGYDAGSGQLMRLQLSPKE